MRAHNVGSSLSQRSGSPRALSLLGTVEGAAAETPHLTPARDEDFWLAMWVLFAAPYCAVTVADTSGYGEPWTEVLSALGSPVALILAVALARSAR
jgi:transposase